MLGNFLDSVVSVFSPKWGANRIAYRQYVTRLRAASGVHESMRKLLSGRNGGYEAGKQDRLKGRTVGSPHENDIERRQITTLRWRSWNLFRNNPQARKICRTLGAKVIGRGLSPQPQATTLDGKPFVDFRKRARHVWKEFCKECDFRGKPGYGGQHFGPLSKTALRQVILSGGLLLRFRHLDRNQQQKLGLFIPLQVQLMHVDRLDDQKHGDGWFHGVKLDDAGRTIGYQVLKGGAKSDSRDSVFVPSTEMIHLFAEEDIDQILGAPWMGAALLTMDDRRSYEYSELTAAEMASCFVVGYSQASGQTGGLGLQQNNERDLVDADGNPITRLQPGMILNLGSNGKLETINPARPNTSAEPFLAHLVRSEAVAVAGVKGSTLTGDYRNSSFSSERSADNDVWPELEELQDWFSVSLCQPVYEQVIVAAVTAGSFDDVAGFSAQDFNERKREYLETNWQGPVPRSINPKDDADSAMLRVKNGTSSPQRECAQIGRDWREVLQEKDEFIDYAKELGLPEEVWRQSLAIEQTDSAVEQPAAPRPTEQEQDEQFAARFRNSSFAMLNSAK